MEEVSYSKTEIPIPNGTREKEAFVDKLLGSLVDGSL
jgi:hypothetical protein